MKKNVKVLTVLFSVVVAVCLLNGCNWMSGNFFSDIENDVKVANAEVLKDVYVRYADTKMGTTTPNGYTSNFKVDVTSTLNAVTNTEYGFIRWAAFKQGTTDGCFNPSKQNTNMYYKDSITWNENYGKYELGKSIIEFDDPKNPSTSFVIHKNPGYKIAIVPVVVKRPEYMQSVPYNGKTNVVKNQTIRILFSKPINVDTFKDNIRINSGYSVITDSTEDVEAIDITDDFEITNSASKKLFTLKLKSDNGEQRLMNTNAQITITLYSDIEDELGYKMAENSKITFTVGSSRDSLAPVIQEVTAGIKADAKAYKDVLSCENSFEVTDLMKKDEGWADNAKYVKPDVVYTQLNRGERVKQRIPGYVNLAVKAGDLAGFGANLQDLTLSPQDVSTISYRAKLIMDAATGEAPKTSVELAEKGTGFAMGDKDKSFEPKTTYEAATGDTSGLGTLFTYDIKDLPDGLVRVDLWATDMVGNEGKDEPYYYVYQNGYRSMYFIKDTTPPAVTSEQISTAATGVDNGWYNAKTFATIVASPNISKPIVDANKEFYRSAKDDLKWIFKINPAEDWQPSESDEGWRKISDGNYAFAGATVDVQGLVNIKMAAMDDMGNISTPLALDSVYYDDVNPVIVSTNWTSTAGTPGLTTGKVLKDQTLNIHFKEVTAGIKYVDIAVEKDGVTTADNTLVASNVALSLNGTTISKENYTVANAKITFKDGFEPKSAGTDEAVLSITGITIYDKDDSYNLEGNYKVTARIVDRSRNTDPSVSMSSATIANDSTKPVVTKVYIPKIHKAKEIYHPTDSGYKPDANEYAYWLDYEYVDGEKSRNHKTNYCAQNVPVYITINESNSGVQTIQLGGTMALQESTDYKTKLYYVEEDGTEREIPASSYEKNISGKYIKLNPDAVLKNYEGKDYFVIKLSQIKFTQNNGSDDKKNTASVIVTDKALNAADEVKVIDTENNQKIDYFYVDSWQSAVDGLVVLDNAPTFGVVADESYTNESKVKIVVELCAEEAASGINKLVLDGATFTETSKVTVVNRDNKPVGIPVTADTYKYEIPYELSEDKKTISFKDADTYYVFRYNYYVTVTDVQLDTTNDGLKTVYVYSRDMAGWLEKSVGKSDTITLDTENPSFTKDDSDGNQLGPLVQNLRMYGSSKDTQKGSFIYPRPTSGGTKGFDSTAFGDATPNKNKDGVPLRYFYSNVDYGDKRGLLLTLSASDNNGLRKFGYKEEESVYYFIYRHKVANEEAEVDSDYVLANRNVEHTSVDSRGYNLDNVKAGALVQFFESGYYYSIVAMDVAGNLTPAVTFAVIEDSTKPSLFVDDSKTNTLNDLMTIVAPENTRLFRGTKLTSSERNATSFDYFDDAKHSMALYSNRYITKGGSDNYKVVIKLGSGTTAEDVQLDGKASKVVSAYKDLKLSNSSSGIESYAISHWFGNWLATDSTSDHGYEPAFPYGTVTPDGSILRDYFNFWYNEGTTSKWLCVNEVNDWHAYKANTTYTDKGTTSTSSDYAIKSEIDSNGDLIIYIPNKSNTPPLALLLKDGCGNLNYVFIKPTSMVESEVCKDYAQISWYVDSSISAPTLYPQTEYCTGSGSYKYGDKSYNLHMNDNNTRSRNNLIISDDRKKVNYYNENAYLTLQLPAGSEKFIFDLTPDSLSGGLSYRNNYIGDADNYSVRARLLASKAATVTYNDFINTTTSAASDWMYTKLFIDGTFGPEIVLSYPHINYEELNWNPSESYYIYYLIEDAVGNYRTGKVYNVNAKADDDEKWLYDNTPPVITVRGTSISPAAISIDQINTLVPDNNNFRSHGNSGVGYIASSGETAYTTKYGNYNSNVGNGTTRYVEGARETGVADNGATTGTDSRRNLPFFDIEVNSEATGIRAFAYTTSSTPPASRTAAVTNNNTQGDNKDKYWYAGYGAYELGAAIGCDFFYNVESSVIDVNAYDKSSIYKNGSKYYYTGTKINTVMPYGLLNTSSATPLYLHVMDWVGNIATYKMGDFSWQNDITTPDSSSSALIEFKDNYYIRKGDSYTGEINIAGLSEEAKNGEKIKIYMPDNFFTDGGSGVYGWAIKTSGTNQLSDNPANIKFETDPDSPNKGKSYIELDSTEYNDTAKSLEISVFDGVGHSPVVKYSVKKDSTAPVLNVKVSNAEGKNVYTGKSAEEVVSYYYFDSIKSSSPCNDFTSVQQKSAKVYTAGSNFYFTMSSSVSDLKEISVKKWDTETSKWTEVASVKNKLQWNSPYWTSVSDTTTGTWNTSSDYRNTIALSDRENSYYQVSISDFSGNTNYGYYNVIHDPDAPVFTQSPVLEPVVGAINRNPKTNKYYYNTANLKFQASDNSGSGLYSYDLYQDTDSLKTRQPLSGTEQIMDLGTTDYSGKLNITVRDNLLHSYKEAATYNGVEISALVNDRTQPATPSAVAVYDDEKGYTSSSFKTLAGSNEKPAYYYNSEENTLELTDFYINRIQYSPTCSSSDVMGYIELKEPLAEGTKAGNYSAPSTGGPVKTTFEHPCSWGDSDAEGHIQLRGDTYTYYYYAVDYAGNISEEPFVLKYKLSLNSVPTNINVTYTTNLKTYLNNNYDYYKTYGYDKTGNFTDAGGSIVQIDRVNYAGNVQLAVTCTLQNRNSSRPKKVSIYTATSYNSDNNSLENGALIAEWSTSDNSHMIRYVSSNVNGNNRYPCLVIVPNFVNQQFNTDKRKVYLVLDSDAGSSKYFELSCQPEGASTASSVWEIDTASDVPYIEGSLGKTVKDTTSVVENNGTYWYKDSSSSLTITYTGVKDNASGLFGYAVNSTVFNNAVAGNDVTFKNLTDGTAEVYAFDKVGHVSASPIDQITFAQDSSLPVIGTITPELKDSSSAAADTSNYYADGNNYYFKSGSVSKVTFPVKAVVSDAGSGFSYFKYKVGAGSWNTVSEESVTVNAPASATTYTFVAVDGVGNESAETSITLTPDSTAPAAGTASFTFTDNSNGDVSAYVSGDYYNTEKVTKLKVSLDGASDTGSGLKGYYYTSSTGSTSSVSSSTEFEIALTGTATYTVYAVDNVGNSVKISEKTVTADSDTPVVSVSSVSNTKDARDLAGNTYTFYNTTTEYMSYMSATVSNENGSGLAAYGFSMNASAEPSNWTSASGTSLKIKMTEATELIKGNTTSTLVLWVKDKVGHVNKVDTNTKYRPLESKGTLEYSANYSFVGEPVTSCTYSVTFTGSSYNAIKRIVVSVPNVTDDNPITGISMTAGINNTSLSGGTYSGSTVTYDWTSNPVMCPQQFTLKIEKKASSRTTDKPTITEIEWLAGETLKSSNGTTIQASQMIFATSTVDRKASAAGAVLTEHAARQVNNAIASADEKLMFAARMITNPVAAVSEAASLSFNLDEHPVEKISTGKLAEAAAEVAQWISTEKTETSVNVHVNSRTLEDAEAKSAEIIERINNSAAAAEVETMAVSAPVAVSKTAVRENNKTLIIMLSIFAACSIGAILIMVLKKLLTKKVQ